jgi:glyoxylase-like metal-dependent hydrolase (beta-lactamase superfamily II)
MKMPIITEPQRLTKTIELIDIKGWKSTRTTGTLIVQGKETAIIETGNSSCSKHILNELDKRHIPRNKVRYLCVTHRHGDHCGGATPLAAELPNAVVAGHKYALATLHNPEKLNIGARQLFGNHAEDIQPLPTDASIQELEDGDILDLGAGVEIEAIGTPGHTSDHLAYFERQSRTLYTGDAAGLFGPMHHTVSPTSFPPSFKFTSYRESIEKLQRYDPANMVFSHFGAVTGPDVKPVLERGLSTLDDWRNTIEKAWQNEHSKSAIMTAIRNRFLDEVEVFPPEARPVFIQVMALGFAQSLYPELKQ